MIRPFDFVRMPSLVFGAGKFAELPQLIAGYSSHVALVTGASSFRAGEHWDNLTKTLGERGIAFTHITVAGEPSPAMVDEAVARLRAQPVDAVVAWGGGSVLDAGKAIAAMLPLGEPIIDYLEGVGTKEHPGATKPLIAVPTTAGTGSEATKNAVISQVGEDGFKKSLRHDNFVPAVALVDPELAVTCPPAVTAACGMDAFTQLLEGYVSTGASPLTDALAWSGLECIARTLPLLAGEHGDDVDLRGQMAYAALMSGLVLANAGLGAVHGFAAAVGGYFPIAHGVVCGTLMLPANELTIEKLARLHGWDHPALVKFAKVGGMLAGIDAKNVQQGCKLLLSILEEWTELLQIPRLGAFGVGENDLPKIVAAAGNKSNPVKLSTEELTEVLRRRL